MPGDRAAIAVAPTRFLVGNLLTFLACALIGAGLVVIAHRLRVNHRVAAGSRRPPRWGWLLHTSVIAHNAVSYELALAPDRAASAVLAENIYSGPVFVGLLVPMLVLTVFGTAATAIAWWRIGQFPWWAAVAIVLALVSDFVAPEQVSGIPMFVLLVAGFGPLARRSTRQPHANDEGPSPVNGRPIRHAI